MANQVLKFKKRFYNIRQIKHATMLPRKVAISDTGIVYLSFFIFIVEKYIATI